MSSSTWTLEMLQELEAAIAKGVKIVKYRDKLIEYQSISEMLKLRAEMRKCLGLTCKQGRILPSTNKGLGC